MKKMELSNGIRQRAELLLQGKPTRIFIAVTSGVAAWFFAYGLAQVSNSIQANRLLFAAGIAAFTTFVAVSWSRVSYLNRDITTGIARRVLAQERLDRLNAIHADATIAIIDVNNLKAVNDNPKMGYDEGDRLIKEVADRLVPVARRKSRMLARLGGDEFIIICTGADCRALAREIQVAISGE